MTTKFTPSPFYRERLKQLAGGLNNGPTAAEIVPLMAELLRLLGHPTEGLSQDNAVEWLHGYIGQLQAADATGDADVGDAAFSMALSGKVSPNRLRIAKDIAGRRGITLEAALQAVPE